MCAAAGSPGTRFTAVRRFAEIDSTNRYLLDEARAGAPEGVVAVADYQHAGRGRLGRRWEAPVGSNLLMSVLLRPDVAVEELHLCTVAVALAAADACRRVAGLLPQLKWPNDLVVGDRKLAGILAESVGGAAAVRPAVVVGLGLNVGWPPADASDGPGAPDAPGPVVEEGDLVRTATSLRRETSTDATPGEVLDHVLAELEPRVVALGTAAGRRGLAGEYRARCATLGRAVRVSQADGDFTGTAADITVEGHLVVDVGAGLRTVAAGDVVHLRAPG